MSWMGGWFDPELEDLFHDEPELLETARTVRAARPRVEADPRFQNRLRAQLVAEASRGHSVRGVRRWWRLGPAHFAWGGAFVGAALITATVFTFVANHTVDQTVTAYLAAHRAALGEPEPGDHGRVQPADERAGRRAGRPHPAGDQGVVCLEEQRPRDLARASPLGKYAVHGDHRPERHQCCLGRVRGGPDQHHLRDSADAATGTRWHRRRSIPRFLGRTAPAARCSTRRTVRWSAPPACRRNRPRPPPSASVTAAASTPSASPTPTPEGAITQTPEVPGGLVEFPRAGTPCADRPRRRARQRSRPTASTWHWRVDDGNGGSRIVAAQKRRHAAGAAASTRPTPVTALTWASQRPNHLHRRHEHRFGRPVERQRPLYTLPAGSGTITALAPGGDYAYVAPRQRHRRFPAQHHARRPTRCSRAPPATSHSAATVRRVAWIDESAQPARLLTEAVVQRRPGGVTTPGSTASPSDVTLDQKGDEVAYLSTDSGGVSELVVAQLPSGTPLAIDSPSNASQLTLSPAGDQIAFVSNNAGGASIEQAAVPGTTKPGHGSADPGRGQRDPAAIRPGAGRPRRPARRRHPCRAQRGRRERRANSRREDLSRAYVISTYLAQGGVVASVELIVDPNAGHTTARVASETLLLAPGPTGGYVVTSAR